MQPADTCDEAQPELLRQGIALFNAGEYFACHEALEDLWREEHRPVRRLHQGILQVAVALHHLGLENRKGARSMLAKAMEHLRPFVPSCQGVDVAALLCDAQRLAEALGRGETPPPDAASIRVKAAA